MVTLEKLTDSERQMRILKGFYEVRHDINPRYSPVNINTYNHSDEKQRMIISTCFQLRDCGYIEFGNSGTGIITTKGISMIEGNSYSSQSVINNNTFNAPANINFGNNNSSKINAGIIKTENDNSINKQGSKSNWLSVIFGFIKSCLGSN